MEGHAHHALGISRMYSLRSHDPPRHPAKMRKDPAPSRTSESEKVNRVRLKAYSVVRVVVVGMVALAVAKGGDAQLR